MDGGFGLDAFNQDDGIAIFRAIFGVAVGFDDFFAFIADIQADIGQGLDDCVKGDFFLQAGLGEGQGTRIMSSDIVHAKEFGSFFDGFPHTFNPAIRSGRPDLCIWRKN